MTRQITHLPKSIYIPVWLQLLSIFQETSTRTELARILKVTPSHIIKIVDSLEQAGLIIRQQKRGVYVPLKLTQKAKRLQFHAKQILRELHIKEN